jgi:POT family proton-dependent oligopeptide transporter
MSVYLSGIPGGWIADRFLGHYRAVFVADASSPPTTSAGRPRSAVFFTGLVDRDRHRPAEANVSSMVGSLYRRDDERRDAGFSIFYMGINLGAFIAR